MCCRRGQPSTVVWEPLGGTNSASSQSLGRKGPDPHSTVEETEAGGGNRDPLGPGHPLTEGTRAQLAQGHQPAHGRARPPSGQQAPMGFELPPFWLQSWRPLPCSAWHPPRGERPLPPWKGPGPHSPAPGRSPCGPQLGPESIKAGF